MLPSMTIRGWVGAALVIALAGCGGSSGKGYTSTQAVFDRLNSKGFDCANLEQQTGKIGVQEEAACDHGEDAVIIDIYRDANQAESTRKAFGALVGGFTVEGKTWDVHVETKAEFDQVSAALK
jgi:hypothetical protein